jgi:hypothetical protein
MLKNTVLFKLQSLYDQNKGKLLLSKRRDEDLSDDELFVPC